MLIVQVMLMIVNLKMQWLKRIMMIYKTIIGWMHMLMDVIHVRLFNI